MKFLIRSSVQVLEMSLITVRWFQTESKEIVMVITSEMRVITALPLTTPIRQVIEIKKSPYLPVTNSNKRVMRIGHLFVFVLF